MITHRKWHDEVWVERYGHVCPAAPGRIVTIHGIGERDAYNPALFESATTKILAFRCELRKSSVRHLSVYHPSIMFARPESNGAWQVDPKIEPFDMLEDPFIFYIEEDGMQKVVMGGVRIRDQHGTIIPQTEYYKGDSLRTLDRVSFAVVHTMKDVRLMQLPDKRFLVCRRPKGDKYKRGRITMHIIDSLEQLVDIDKLKLRTLAVLDSGQEALDWVGVNDMQIVKDHEGRAWIGLLGHVALESNHQLHYAASTYKISLEKLMDLEEHSIVPKVIATRACFEDGPYKNDEIKDIVFPGHLEHVEDYTYRLWTGLSDTRVGSIEIDDPFGLRAV